jgi:molybdate/tungstate transport system substrate-binding protein
MPQPDPETSNTIDDLFVLIYGPSGGRLFLPRGIPSWIVTASILAAPAALSGCGAAASPPSVQVAYAGSLAYLMDQVVGPHFHKATHLVYQGRGGGSFAIAQEIRSQTIAANAFLSIGTAPFSVIANRVPWTVTFATAPLVLAYNPKSRFAPALEAIATGRKPFRDLFAVLSKPGFHLGRTNPATDPQGRAFYLMVVLAQKIYGLPADTVSRVVGTPENAHQIFSETGILTQLQSGNLDAASAFLPEVLERHMAYVPLAPTIDFGDPNYIGVYREAHAAIPGVGQVTGSLLTVAAAAIQGPGYKRGVRFLEFALSPQIKADWVQNGYTWLPFQFTGLAKEIPTELRSESP